MGLAALLIALLAGCEQSHVSNLAQRPLEAATPAVQQQREEASSHDRHAAGRRVYNFYCYFCHGYSGDARTVASRYLNPPPRDFTQARLAAVTRAAMVQAVRDGRAGTAMQSFGSTLTQEDIEVVVDFVRSEFMREKRPNTRYHTAQNGWPAHERYRDAFALVSGDISVDTPADQLSLEQQNGQRLFTSLCIHCHDALGAKPGAITWEPRALSYPRNGYSPQSTKVDAIASATPYAIHDRPPEMPRLNSEQRRGGALYQKNCAFCHAADGTGRNWIGSFLEPHPRDLTDKSELSEMSEAQLAAAIADGLLGTSMPAWKSVLSEQDIQAIAAYVNRAFRSAR